MIAFDRIPVPPAAVSRVLSRFDRPALEGFIAVALDLLDLADGDPDAEDATNLEDDHTLSPQAVAYTAHQPGCELSDGGDISATEWHTRGRYKDTPGITAKNGMPISEDIEEDDPAGQCDEDGVNTCLIAALGNGPGCKISDPDAEHDGREPDYR